MDYAVGRLYRLIVNGEHKVRTDIAPVLCVAVDVLNKVATFCAPCGGSCDGADKDGNEEYYDFDLSHKDSVFQASMSESYIGSPMDAFALGCMFIVDHTPLPYVPERWNWWDTEDTCVWFREDVWAELQAEVQAQMEAD